MNWGILSDLDGTLLDDTYHWTGAEEILGRLLESGILLVLATTKTEDEVRSCIRCICESWPEARIAAVVENGGGVLWPGNKELRALLPEGDYDLELVPLGVELPRLEEGLRTVADRLRIRVTPLTEMSLEEFMEYSKLPREQALQAQRRRFDLPFLVPSEAPSGDDLEREARALGLRITRGGLFHHIHGESDKRMGAEWIFRKLASEGSDYRWVGLGDSQVDASFLQAVEYPVQIPAADGRYDEAIRRQVPEVRPAPLPGPRGWAAAMEEWARSHDVLTGDSPGPQPFTSRK